MRLYDISYNENQWSVKGSRDSGYTIVHKTTFEAYSISGDVIGIDQISDDEFLVHNRFMRDTWHIRRVKLKDGQLIIEYNHNFKYFNFLTDDIIIFDYKRSCHGAKLYSISKNSEFDDLNHLISGNLERHDASYVNNRDVELLYQNKVSQYPTYLLVDYQLQHTFITDEHLQLILDSNSLQPLTPVYSTLRGKYFTLSDSLTLRDLVEEENHYLYIIDGFLKELYYTANTKSTEELLSMIEKTE